MAQSTSSMVVDMNTPSYPLNLAGNNLWQLQTLQQATILQSMAFDYKKTIPEIYVMQCRNGDVDAGKTLGEMVINRLGGDGQNLGAIGTHLTHYHHSSEETFTMESEWNPREMTVYEKYSIGFGHGTQIALEYAPDGIYIWFDYGSFVINRSKTPTTAQWDVVGTQLARTKYNNGTFLKPISPQIQALSNSVLGIPDGPFKTGTSYHTVSIDNHNKLFAVKYVDHTDNDKMKVSVYKMSYGSGYTNHPNTITYTHQNTFYVESMPWWLAREDGTCSSKKSQLVPNGWAMFGDYIYMGYGTAYWNSQDALQAKVAGQWKFFSPDEPGGTYFDGTPIEKRGNVHLRCYNWKTGELVSENFTEAGYTNVHRELEGLAIIPKIVNGIVQEIKLVFAFAGGPTGDRNWSMFYKENTNIPTT